LIYGSEPSPPSMIRGIAAAISRLFVVVILLECVKPGTHAGGSIRNIPVMHISKQLAAVGRHPRRGQKVGSRSPLISLGRPVEKEQ